jgi:Skp family chaperone for outer membrane proteins
MKKAVIFILFIFSGVALGQSPNNLNSKIALVDFDRFFDKTNGVTRLAAAYAAAGSLDTAFSMGGSSKMQKRIKELEVQIAIMEPSNIAIPAIKARLADLQREYKRLDETDKAAYESRYSQVVSPVLKQIHVLAKEYAAKNEIDLILNKDLNFVYVGETSSFKDITDDLIAYCNSFFAKQKPN